MIVRDSSLWSKFVFATLLFTFATIGCSEKLYQKKGINKLNGGDVGIGQEGRKVIYRDRSMITNTKGMNGIIVMNICIDRKGNVVKVDLNENETSIEEDETLKNALSAMKNYKYETDTNAPEE